MSFTSPLAQAAPFTPANDAEVVERLPARAADDPTLRRVESLRKQLAAQPQDAALRIEIARRYFDLAMAQGDPRYVGYASGAIAPLASADPRDAAYWLVRGQLEQYNHDFEAALASLARAAELAPALADAYAWRAAIFMVQARAREALAECERLAPLAEPLWAVGCRAYARAGLGELQPAFDELSRAAGASPQATPAVRLWADTRLAEMALRLQRPEDAERFFRRALGLDITDQFLLAAYADFLLARQRAPEALKLLAGWERSDILLLRLALAGRAANDPRANEWTGELRERFQAAARRGDTLHEWEAARFELEVENRPERALQLAAENYKKQKEPRDAEMLMRTALAANRPAAAEPALAWLRSSGYQDPALAALSQQLAAKGGQR
ncbi:tetratricopeptide repeat protein [Ramlibacter tataouinensis]|uniref:tetratricopeptide repeat protein n=1 Tax=Ramlibacter tataouinensis TaxID=94132 RepID=UPI00117E99D5|nr:hypothetical protein [Ramlibacter tataouinensis]